MAKWVYMFTEGNANMRNLLGGKGANLAEMTEIGLPVPQGFTISTEACTQYYEDGRKINDEIIETTEDHPFWVGGTMAALALVVATMTANSTCLWLFHQPEEPEEVKMLKKD